MLRAIFFFLRGGTAMKTQSGKGANGQVRKQANSQRGRFANGKRANTQRTGAHTVTLSRKMKNCAEREMTITAKGWEGEERATRVSNLYFHFWFSLSVHTLNNGKMNIIKCVHIYIYIYIYDGMMKVTDACSFTQWFNIFFTKLCTHEGGSRGQEIHPGLRLRNCTITRFICKYVYSLKKKKNLK